MSERKRADILILGIGNILLRDEGVGVRVIEVLGSYSLPEGVELVDGGTAGADLLDVIADREQVIVIDAIGGDFCPGTIVRFSQNELEQLSRGPLASLHDLNLTETLIMARLLGCAPGQVTIFGIKPAVVECGIGLSREVEKTVPAVIREIQSEIERLRMPQRT